MRTFQSTFGLALAFATSTVCLSTLLALPVRADDAWEKLLRIQLEDGHKCTLSGVVFVRELPAPEGILYSGKAKCFDGREFDFSQSKPHMKFDIKACEPTVC